MFCLCTGGHTLLANLEHLVGFPGDDAPRKSAPAPFQDTAEHHGVCETKLLGQFIATDGSPPGHGVIEKGANKGTRIGSIGAGTKGQEQERSIQSCQRAMISKVKNAQTENNLPRAFNSCVQPRSRSCTSSGATSVRCQASVQEGVGGVGSCSMAGDLAAFLAALESLPRKTRVKKGILGVVWPESQI